MPMMSSIGGSAGSPNVSGTTDTVRFDHSLSHPPRPAPHGSRAGGRRDVIVVPW